MKKIIFLIILFLNLNLTNSYSSSELYEKIDLFGEVLEKIKTDYVDDVNQSKMMDSAINGVLQSLDPYSAYMSPELFKKVLMKIIDIKKNIEKILDNNKASNITSINLKNKSYIADYMIIASGTSSRHLQALSEILLIELKKIGLEKCRIEGRESNDWKLVDANDIIIHIFHPEKRKFYDLEKMWSEEIPKEKAIL